MSDVVTTTQAPEQAEEERRLGSRELSRSFWRYIWSFQISWNYERMQALGFCWSMEPVLRRLYPDKDEYATALQRHLQFFNTSPIVGGPLILGSTIAMEEAASPTSAESVKVATMGPLAGIGDTVTYALYNSIIFTIGASWALQGKIIGPIFTALLVLVPYFLIRRWQFYWAYRQGRQLTSQLASGMLARISEGATILGLVVLGGFIPSIIKLVTTLTYRQTVTVQGKQVTQAVGVQQQLDQVLPFLLPTALAVLVYVLLKRFRLNPMWVIAIVAAVGIALGWLGWFAPEVAASAKQ
jgi:mannose/fructose/N-acetylgalactosamine-specific phosphotransferase system component IID